MLPPLTAEQQLLAIEAATVPRMKPDDARRVLTRHQKATRPPEERKGMALQMLDAFQAAGFQVVHEETPKR